jgi:hypothetical protein
MTDTQPEALRLADELDAVPETGADPQTIQEAAAELRRLHAYCQELESHLILDCMTHVQNPAENEHVAGDVSKNGAELNMSAQQPAPASQQEAQEPVAWYVTGCGRLLEEDEAKAEARHIGGTARAIPVYTAPQPSPAAQGYALDAARYRYLRDGDWRENDKLESIIRLQLNSLWDAAIDAARAAQEGKKP